MIENVVLLALIPFAAAAGLWLLSGQPGIPLPQRNLERATYSGLCLTYIVALSASVRLNPPFDMASFAVGAIALLYLVVGVRGSRGTQFDVMAMIYWSAAVPFWGWLCLAVVMPLRVPPLFYAMLGPAVSLVHPVMVAGCIAAGVASVLRVVLMLQPVPGPKLPPPSKVPGMPIAGSASASAAHAAINRSGTARPKFRT